MRIGLFTDTYRPSINGIVYVVESTKRELEALGHEVFVFCPARSIRPGKQAEKFDEDEHVIRFPSVKGVFYEDYDTAIFFPPRVNAQIGDMNLDIIHIFTPGQIGLMGVFAGRKHNISLVAQHCTDLYQYIEHYSDGLLLPGLLTLIATVPFSMKLTPEDRREIMKIYRPRRSRVAWNQDLAERMVTLVYKKCDAVIALSRKSKAQLESWQHTAEETYEVTLLPNGVNRLPAATAAEVQEFRSTWGIAPDDEIIGFVGRLSAEKNLDLLVHAMEKIVEKRPRARLLFVGDFEYREALETLANESHVADRITFTGALPRETLGAVYGAMQVFVFPSLTDTQGWAVHEAAGAGLPLVLVDRGLSEVLRDGENGYYARNGASSVASKVVSILEDKKKQRQFGAKSQELAAEFTEERQIAKLAHIYESIAGRHHGEE